MSYQNFGPAEHERQQSTARQRSVAEEVKHLEVTSPINGIVTTPRLHDLMGAYLKSGTEVAEVADLSTMTARIYVPEFSMRDVHLGASGSTSCRVSVPALVGRFGVVGSSLFFYRARID